MQISNKNLNRIPNSVGMDTAERVIVVGGGLVGSMAACFFAKRGVKVEVYELRQGKSKFL